MGELEPTPEAQPKWVWYSTPETAEARIVSVLACVETLVAMAIYAWVFVYVTKLHLLIAVCVAPFLLLRTPLSTELGRFPSVPRLRDAEKSHGRARRG